MAPNKDKGSNHVLDYPNSFANTIFLVVMGVSGTGKSTLGAALSNILHLPFIDGDDFHSQSNVAKMSRGEPLTDADRQPWLETIRKTAVTCVLSQLGLEDSLHIERETENALVAHERSIVGRAKQPRDQDKRPGIIIACSSLKEEYRSVIRGETLSKTELSKHQWEQPRTYFVYMKGSRQVLMDRMTKRQEHFMKAGMLDSQLNTLESPEHEDGVVTVSIEWSTEDQVQEVVRALKHRGNL